MERAEYEQDLKRYRDYHNTISYARMEGREEKNEEKNLVIIKVSLKKGFSLDVISELTQLSIEAIKRIIKKQNW